MSDNLPMALPKCPAHDRTLELRPDNLQTPEQRWCGLWYDCPSEGCGNSYLDESPELAAFLMTQESGTRQRELFN